MGENSAIAWTDHTFNPWMGCLKVSPGCEHCYAETLVTNRMRLNVWGPPSTTSRQRTSAANWKKPLAWDRAAAKAGKRTRVFCASLADVFEDHPQVVLWRGELFALIEQTPHLDWQLLTKRPENLRRFLPQAWLDKPRPNVWLGTTVEDQKRAEERIPHLLATKAAVRFLSCEPLLEAVNLADYLTAGMHLGPVRFEPHRGVDWVIVGGESGPKARPFDLAWARSLRDQCASSEVAFFCKQLGANAIDSDGFDVMNERGGVAYSRGRGVPDAESLRLEAYRAGRIVRPLNVSRFLCDRAGADPAEWPEADLIVQQFPEVRR